MDIPSGIRATCRSDAAQACGPHRRTKFDLPRARCHRGSWASWASWLTRLGFPAGTHVAVSFHISVEAVAAVLRIWKAGCVVVTNHPSFSEDKLIQQIVSSESRAFITDRGNVLTGVFLSTNLEGCLLINDDAVPPNVPRATRFADLRDKPYGYVPNFVPSRRLPVAIFHTTGSTFTPKGVIITHGNMLAAFRSITSCLNSTPQDIVMHYASFSFDFGIHNTIMPLLFGGTSIAGSAVPDDPEEIQATIEGEGVTALHFMPFETDKLIHHSDRDSQYLSIRYAERLAEAGIDTSIRSVGGFL